jgi:uncharacterized protein involved in outer membrane biogenesis
MKTFRVILIALALLLMIAGGATYYLLSSLDSIVEAAIEKYGSLVTGTTVRVSSVRIGLKEGKGTINGLSVDNPKGFSMPYAFTLGRITIRIDPSSMTQTPYIIKEITVRDPEAFYEVNESRKANVDELQRNIVRDQADPSTTSGKQEETRIVIDKLSIEGARVHVKVAALRDKEKTIKLPPLSLNHIGRKTGGATPSEVADIMLSALIKQVKDEIARQGFEKYLDKEIEKTREELKQRLEEKLDAKKGKSKETLKKLLQK